MRLAAFRSPGLRPLLFSLVVVTTVASKILHLYQHIRSVPYLSFLLYLPTFFLTDLVVCVLAWTLLSIFPGAWGTAALVVVAILGYVLVHASFLFVDFLATLTRMPLVFLTSEQLRLNLGFSMLRVPKCDGTLHRASPLTPLASSSS